MRRLRAGVPLTWSGATAVLATAAAATTGLALGWLEGLLLAAWLAVVLLLGLPAVLGGLPATAEMSLVPPRTTPGGEAACRVVVSNPGGRGLASVTLELPVGRDRVDVRLDRLEPGERRVVDVPVPARARGLVPCGPVTASRGDVLRLWRRTVVGEDTAQLIVHPVHVRPASLSAGALRDLEGGTSDDLSASDIAFHALREYVPGDDRRHVHWRSSAKAGVLLVRQYEDTRRARISVGLSTAAVEYSDIGAFELAVSVAASLGLRAVRDGQEVDMLAGTKPLPSPTGTQLLDGCAGVDLDGTDGARRSGVLPVARSLARRGGAVTILVTGGQAASPATTAAVRTVSGSGRVLLVRVRAGAAVVGHLDRATTLDIGALEQLPGALRSAVAV